MVLKALLADMDDTVLVHDVLADDLWREVVLKNVGDAPDIEAEALIAAIIRRRHEFWDDTERARAGRADMSRARIDFVTQAVVDVGIGSDTLIESLVSSFSHRREESVVMEAEAKTMLLRLRNAGLLLGLITNGGAEGQRDKVERFHLEEYFDSVVIEGEVGVGKPDRRIYDMALDALGVTTAEAVMVGDNWLWEVVAPMEYGMRAVWVRRLGTPVPADIGAGFLGTIRFFGHLGDVLPLSLP